MAVTSKKEILQLECRLPSIPWGFLVYLKCSFSILGFVFNLNRRSVDTFHKQRNWCLFVRLQEQVGWLLTLLPL